MNVIKTYFSDVFLFEPKVFGDSRGFFYESYNEKVFHDAINRKVNFVQDNHSLSSKGVLRGLHYQEQHPQGKLVRVTTGAVFDVVVDIRKNSKTFGQWQGFDLNDENKHMLWVPEGYAHGFLTLSDQAEFLYKVTDFWCPEYERTILWNDPTLNILWPSVGDIKVSEKDQEGCVLKEIY